MPTVFCKITYLEKIITTPSVIFPDFANHKRIYAKGIDDSVINEDPVLLTVRWEFYYY